jgi:ssDNA-binding Zn-finger/Zn-ribbon topoisomerase 1
MTLPRRRAKRKPLPGVRSLEIQCPECGAPMLLRDSRYGPFYGCSRFPECRSAHGAHPDGRPLGIPATKLTKDARIRAHAAFDSFWRARDWRRGQAYAWMQQALGLAKDEAHIGRFDIEQCEKLIAAVASASSRSPS